MLMPIVSHVFNGDRFFDRAVRAHFAHAERHGYAAMQPNSAESGVWDVDGRWYVVLQSCDIVHAVYRVLPNERLRRLKRYPAALRF